MHDNSGGCSFSSAAALEHPEAVAVIIFTACTRSVWGVPSRANAAPGLWWLLGRGKERAAAGRQAALHPERRGDKVASLWSGAQIWKEKVTLLFGVQVGSSPCKRQSTADFP